jgi:hypothetical protein
LQALLWPGGDDHCGCRIAGGFGGQAGDLAEAGAGGAQRGCGPGAEQGIDEVFGVLVQGEWTDDLIYVLLPDEWRSGSW